MTFKTLHWPTVRNVAERVASVGLVVVPLVVIAFWLTLHHKPSWYRPADLDEPGMQQARREAIALADSVSHQMVERKPFDIVLSDASITKWLAALPSIWPEGHKRIPPELSDIAVTFDDGVMRIGARYEGSWHAIVNVYLELGVTGDGSALWFKSSRVYGGSVPLPMSVIQGALLENARKVSTDQTQQGEDSGGELPSARGSDDPQDVSEVIEKKNRFVWFNGRRPFRITSIQLVPGELHLKIEPL